MIQNEREYRITKARAAEFSDELDELRERASRGEAMAGVLASGVESKLADLQAELNSYEALQKDELTVLSASSLAELPAALIQARIAAGLTQKELAARLGIKAQQIQRYEAGGYDGASLRRIQEVADALNVKVRGLRVVSLTGLTTNSLLKRVTEAGVD